MKKNLHAWLYLSFITISLTACCWFNSISAYDSYSFSETTAIKNESTALINKSNENFALHEKEVEALKTKILHIYAYENSKCKNKTTIEQWEVVKAENGTLYKFFGDWKQKSVMNPYYSAEISKVVGQIFDNILELESKKQKR